MDSGRDVNCSIWAGEAGSAPCSRSHARTAVTASHDVTTSSPGTMLHSAALVASTSSSITFTEACGVLFANRACQDLCHFPRLPSAKIRVFPNVESIVTVRNRAR